MGFRITGLPLARFAPLFRLDTDQLAARNILRMTADRCPGFPCRVSLRDAAVGETVLLLNHEHLAVAGPYRSSHAIFIREAASEARLTTDEAPPVLQSRLLSVRAFDAQGMMVAAEVVPGADLAALIGIQFTDPAVSYLHVHNAKPGCYAARVDRA
jgi:hypothetical protein